MRNGPFRYRVCAMCGKEFIKHPDHIYKVRYKGQLNQCCSYTCYRNALKLKEKLHNENTKKDYS